MRVRTVAVKYLEGDVGSMEHDLKLVIDYPNQYHNGPDAVDFATVLSVCIVDNAFPGDSGAVYHVPEYHAAVGLYARILSEPE